MVLELYFVGMNRVSGTGDYTIDQYAATDDGGLLTVTKGGTALHVKCSADQLAVVETQPDGTFHLHTLRLTSSEWVSATLLSLSQSALLRR